MYRVAICDDDRNAARQLEDIVKEFQEKYVIDIFTSGEELLCSKEEYQILFLDIDMSGMNGIEAARELRKRDKCVKIVYVTSYTDYIHYAFSVHAFAYLLKPISKEEVLKQLEEAVSYHVEMKETEKLRFDTKEGVVEASSDQILYFEYLERKVHMHLRGKTVVIRGGIGEMAERMERYGFAMPHKSFVVNLYHVKVIKGYDVYMTDETRIPLSQKKSTDFRKKLHRFLGDCI